MERHIYIIMHNDLMHYPTMISLIDILKDLGHRVTYIGEFSESPTTTRFRKEGVELIQLGYNRIGSQLNRYLVQRKYKKRLSAKLRSIKMRENDLIWYVYSDSATFIHKLLAQYKYVVHFYEFTRMTYSWKFKLLYPSFSQPELCKKAVGVIHCQYDRAQIYKGLAGLSRTPYVLPNKMYESSSEADKISIPNSIKEQIESIKKKIGDRKVILYQGVFESKERKLDEFCQAISLMSDDYMLIAMGRGDESYIQLKEKYESDRILFIPFIIPPFHLEVTKLASVGVLSYSTNAPTINGVINPMYCAPNKIFEYSKFSIPMISNDIPGLKRIFEQYHCGRVVTDPITPDKICVELNELFSNIEEYRYGSFEYYNSVDTFEIVKSILAEI